MKTKNYSIELLRIFCMLGIVATHTEGYFARSPMVSSLSVLQVGAVDCFVLITGYFGISREKFIHKFLSISFLTIFYNVLLVLLFGHNGNFVYDLFKACYITGPVCFNYWFVSKYLALVLLAPFLNILAEQLKGSVYFKFLAVLIMLNITIAYGFPFGDLYGGHTSLSLFCLLYLTGIGLRRLLTDHKVKLGYAILILIFLYCLYWFTCSRGFFQLCRYNNALVYSIAIVLFIIFSSIHIGEKWGKLISFFSTNVFAVYLIHDNYYMRIYMKKIAAFFQFPGGGGLWAFGIFLITVFCCCVLIDKVRSWLFVRLGINKAISSLGNYISAKVMRNVD